MTSRIAAYRRIMTQGQYAGETGATYQLESWAGNTREYTAYDEPVTVELADGYRLSPGTDEYPPAIVDEDGDEYTLLDAIAIGAARIVGQP